LASLQIPRSRFHSSLLWFAHPARRNAYIDDGTRESYRNFNSAIDHVHAELRSVCTKSVDPTAFGTPLSVAKIEDLTSQEVLSAVGSRTHEMGLGLSADGTFRHQRRQLPWPTRFERSSLGLTGFRLPAQHHQTALVKCKVKARVPRCYSQLWGS